MTYPRTIQTYKQYLLAFGMCVLLYGTICFAPPSLLTLAYREDGIVECAAAFAWAGACLLFLMNIRHSLRFSARKGKIWLVGLALICFIAAGEEISWGQRLFGYATPPIIKQSNLQGEANLHNLTWLDIRTDTKGNKKTGFARWITFNRLGSLLWLGFLVVIPILFRLNKTARKLCERLALPVPPVYIAFAAIINYSIFFVLNKWGKLMFDPHTERVFSSPMNESKETVVAILFFLAALYCYRTAKNKLNNYA